MNALKREKGNGSSSLRGKDTFGKNMARKKGGKKNGKK